MSIDRRRPEAYVTQRRFSRYQEELGGVLEILQGRMSELERRTKRPLEFYEKMDREAGLEELLPIVLQSARVQQVLKDLSQRRWNRWVAIAVIAGGLLAGFQILELITVAIIAIRAGVL